MLVNRTGLLCHECLDHLTEVSGKCESCGASDPGVVAWSVVVGVCALW